MSSGAEPLAQIVSLSLPEDTKCGHPAQVGGCFCAVRTGGDTLAGTLTIKLNSNRRQLVELYFEGMLKPSVTCCTLGTNRNQVCVEHGFQTGTSGIFMPTSIA